MSSIVKASAAAKFLAPQTGRDRYYRMKRSGAAKRALAEDGRPAEAEFTFDVPLEDPSLRWLHWKNLEFLPFTPPAVGGTRVLDNFDSG